MYVLIANGFKGVVESKQTLDLLVNIYPYPKFRKVADKEEALKFMERYKRRDYSISFTNYGNTDDLYGYVTLEYIIDNKDLYANINTSKVGFIRIKQSKHNDTFIDNRPTLIRVKIRDINLNHNLISDHCIAVGTLLNLLGSFVDVNIVVPDVSIYLALTKYTGESYSIKETQKVIQNRIGGVSITIK